MVKPILPDNRHLRALANSPPDVTGIATCTSAKFSATYARWKLWARDHDLPVVPVSPDHFALCLRHLMSDAKTFSPIESTLRSMAWIDHLAGKPSPSEHPLVKDVLARAERLLAHLTSKKEPTTVSQLEQLVNPKVMSMAPLYDFRSVVICLLAFAAFLSSLDSEKLQLFIGSSKIDK